MEKCQCSKIELLKNMSIKLETTISKQHPFFEPFPIFEQISNAFHNMAELINKPKPKPETPTLILLNFEDDTFKPVIKVDDKMVNIIKEWYNNANLSFDVEDSRYEFNNVTEKELTKILYKTIACKNKEMYLNEYIPEVIKEINLKKKTSSFEQTLFQETFQNNSIYDIDVKKNLTLDELKIIIPENLTVKEPEKSPFVNAGSIITEGPEQFIKMSECVVNQDEKMYDAYNHLYNSLNPRFAENAEALEVPKEEIKKKTSVETLLVVLIQPSFLKTIVVLNPTEVQLNIINNYQEYGFIELFKYKTSNSQIITNIKTNYNGAMFEDANNINTTLEASSQYVNFANKNNVNSFVEEEKTVKEFLKNKYDFSDNIVNQMKASVLYEQIIASNICKIEKSKLTGFKNRLSQYLKDLGLQKKRYNDGYYYYGIVLKHTITKPTVKTLEDLIKEREELFRDVQNNYIQ